jgi:hypothetical protein
MNVEGSRILKLIFCFMETTLNHCTYTSEVNDYGHTSKFYLKLFNKTLNMTMV